jgi:hypothetical protein
MLGVKNRKSKTLSTDVNIEKLSTGRIQEEYRQKQELKTVMS